MGSVIINALSKSFFVKKNKLEEVPVLKNINLTIQNGEFVSIFGPNGCGKSTLFNILSGLIPPSNGEVTINGNSLGKAKVGYVFQYFRDSLLPWRKNIDNILLPLELRHIPKKLRLLKLSKLLEKLDINIPLDVYPYQLSGGQQQILAIIRALVDDVDLLLLDEPFSGLNYLLKSSLYEKVLDIWQKTKITTILISHDIEEAIFLAGKLVILSERPASIVCNIEIDIPYPRTIDTLHSQRFFSIKSQAIATLRGLRR